MGITFGKFTPKNWHRMASWSYSGFARFAERLGAQQPGSPLARLQDVETKGEFTAEESETIWPALAVAIIDWPENSEDVDRQQALLLIRQMRKAAQAREPLPYG